MASDLSNSIQNGEQKDPAIARGWRKALSG